MADSKTSALTELAVAPAATDEFYINDGGVSKRIQYSTLQTGLYNSPTMVTPALGTPASGVMTNVTGTAAGLTAGTVTTNANLTGHVTSVGNAAVLGSFTLAELNTAISDGLVGFTADVNTQITPSTAIVLDQATGNEIALDLSFTVNKAAGNYTGLKIYATETAAPGTDDRLLDLGVGVTSKFYIKNSGDFYFAGHSVFTDAGRIVITDASGNRAMATELGQFMLPSSSYLGWGNIATLATDLRLYYDAAGILAQRNGANPQTSRIYGDYASTTDYQRCGIVTTRTATTVPAAASFTLTGFIPDGALLIGITSRVDTTCTTATGYTVGDGVDADLWGVAAAVAVGTATGSADFTAAGASGVFYTAAQNVVITATGGNFDGTGVITVCAHYIITEAD